MQSIQETVYPTSLPTGVFLIISMFLVSLAFRAVNRLERGEALTKVRRLFKLALIHVIAGTILNLGLTWFTMGESAPTPEGQARVTAFFIASGLNALFPSLLGLGGVGFLWYRLNKR